MKIQNIDELMSEVGSGAMKYQFPIATKVNGSFEIQGTCVAISDGDQHFLVTAAHVTNLRHNAANRELYICNWAGDEFIRIEEDIVGYDSHDTIPTELDVSIIKIERSRYQTIPEENFLYIDGIYVDRGESFKRAYALSGFPASKNRSFPKYKTSPYLFFYVTQAAPSSVESLKDIFTLRLAYDHPDVLRPNGMSGGGLWILTDDLPQNPALAGILISWLPAEKIIVAVTMDFIIATIKGFFPGSQFDDISTSMSIIETKSNALLVLQPRSSEGGK